MKTSTFSTPRRSGRHRGSRGFTLIELMIVIAVVAILAAIAYPSYQESLRKSRRAEGKGSLTDVAQDLEKCKTLYGAYNNANCATVGQVTGGNTEMSAEGFYLVSATALTPTTFTLQAVPQQPDPRCGTLTLTQAGVQGSTGSDPVTDCW